MEPTPAEEINPELIEGKPDASHQLSLAFFNHYFMLIMIVH
jgi:hypothetical protein